jgi:hypothetical protein
MKIIYCLLAIILLAACGNKKAEIVEEIKKVKNELAGAKIKHDDYRYAATHLKMYEQAPQSQKSIIKETVDTDRKRLSSESPEIVGDYKKLDSIALTWESKVRSYTNSLDSLELELKKY